MKNLFNWVVGFDKWVDENYNKYHRDTINQNNETKNIWESHNNMVVEANQQEVQSF